MERVPIGPIALDIVPYQPEGRERRVAVIVKATVQLVHDAVATLVEPEPLSKDVHHEGDTQRTLRIASDFAPHKPRADVLFTGHACAPAGERVTERMTRLAIFASNADDGASILDKRVRALGSRERDANGAVSAPTPFGQWPMRYELAYGGASFKANPIGVGAAREARMPNLEHPEHPARVACFAPVPETWWWRTRSLGGTSPSDWRPAGQLPSVVDRAFFNAAPPDQQVPYLSGGEVIVLEGLHPVAPLVRATLPGLFAHASIERGAEPPQAVALVLDTLAIDGDRLRATLTFRGEVDAAALHGETRLLATLAPLGETPIWPSREIGAPVAASPTPPARAKTFSPVATIVGDGAFPSLPFAPRREVLGVMPASPPPLLLSTEKKAAAEVAVPKAKPEPAVEIETVRLPIPPREHEEVPIFNISPLVAWTIPWQVSPPNHALAVVVKGTFRLVPGGPAELAEAQRAPNGDVRHDDDDEQASVRYPSDFAIYKPKADVFLVGHAYATDPRAGVAHVKLTLGGHAHAVAVFGERIFGKLGIPGAPAPFTSMPLRAEHALGGPLSKDNPLGRGFKTGTLLPNLERPDALVTTTGSAPAPAGFGAIEPMWPARAQHLGTYDDAWLRERWPYFPEDFDYAWFNAAQPELQVPHLAGDERWSIAGARPGGATIAGTLPRVRPRLYGQRTEVSGGQFAEVPLVLDTAFFDAEAMELVLVWRGLVAASDDDASELDAFFVLAHEGAAPTREAAHALFVAEVVKRNPVPANVASTKAENAAPTAPAPSRPPPPAKIVARATIEEWVAGRESLRRKDLTGADLSSLDLRGFDLESAILRDASLRGAKLVGAKLVGAVLAGANLEGTDLTRAELTKADLSDASLRGACLAEARLDGARLADTRCEGATFVDANLRGASLARATLLQVPMSRADLTGADLTDANLASAKLDGAKLDDAKLYRVAGEKLDLRRASMVKARLDGADLRGAQLAEADAAESSFGRADLSDANLHRTRLDGAVFVRAKLDGAFLNESSAKGAILHRASVRDASLLRVDLMQASFEGANLEGADLRGANLYQAETWRAKLDRARLDGAIVAGSKLAK